MNKYDSTKHHRQSIRLKGYDYSQSGLYFITICTQNREQLFGEIANGIMYANQAGEMIDKHWNALPERFPAIELYAYIIMPNHLHGIIGIVEGIETKTVAIGDIICAFKSFTTVEYSRAVIENLYPPFNKRLWQRNYYEHIVRSDFAHRKITEYIMNNPAQWEEDEYNV